ncbi:MAG: chorismate-binding protein [Burkholderiaceae bacterium]|nr:chorismate-binding protein [Burkholderiaceae bacterium]
MTQNLSALIDFADPHDAAAPRLRHAFAAPRALWVARTPDEVRPVLTAVEAAAQQGAWCVGFVRYEAAPAFDAALATHAADGPLAWFAVHDAPLPWPAHMASPATVLPPPALHWQSLPERAAFERAFAAIAQAIARGESYQVNLTAQLRGRWQGAAGPGTSSTASSTVPSTATRCAARALFATLQRAQPGGYAAWLDAGEEQVLSVSPELFFDWQGARILTRPMKGTAARGATPAQDAAQAAALRASPKERAENVMIVDLLRNDLSRIAEPHSVQVPALFRTEALPSVWQMTSDVQARVRPGTRLADVFSALFPCGSVTGAPKVRAMQIIRALEPGPRGIYCGAIGVVRPSIMAGGGIHATFNVAIRTVVLRAGEARCGIGSGITADATAEGEWQEWQHKRGFLAGCSLAADGLTADSPAGVHPVPEPENAR